jgi:hypothetical protein
MDGDLYTLASFPHTHRHTHCYKLLYEDLAKSHDDDQYSIQPTLLICAASIGTESRTHICYATTHYIDHVRIRH